VSVRLTSLVKKYGPLNLCDFLVLLALADHANDAGGDCWPSVKTIAAEMRIGKRSVIRSLQKLETDGWITVEKRGKDHRANSYRIALEKLKIGAAQTPEIGATVTPKTQQIGATQTKIGATQIKIGAKSAFPSYEPSLNSPETSRGSGTAKAPPVIAIADAVMAALGLSGRFNREAVVGQIELEIANGKLQKKRAMQ
jgi:DNA-binding MarR family transcriptional regulator